MAHVINADLLVVTPFASCDRDHKQTTEHSLFFPSARKFARTGRLNKQAELFLNLLSGETDETNVLLRGARPIAVLLLESCARERCRSR